VSDWVSSSLGFQATRSPIPCTSLWKLLIANSLSGSSSSAQLPPHHSLPAPPTLPDRSQSPVATPPHDPLSHRLILFSGIQVIRRRRCFILLFYFASGPWIALVGRYAHFHDGRLEIKRYCEQQPGMRCPRFQGELCIKLRLISDSTPQRSLYEKLVVIIIFKCVSEKSRIVK
jgi:hypothetical protein